MGHYDDNAGLWPERVSEGGYFWSTVTLVARRRQQMSAASLQAMPSGLPISAGQHRQNYALQTTARPEAILHSRGCRAQRRPYSAGSIRCSDSNGQGNSATLPAPSSQYQTGGTAPGLSIGNQAKRLRKENLVDEKFVVVVRHGQTTWNEAKRIQVSLAKHIKNSIWSFGLSACCGCCCVDCHSHSGTVSFFCREIATSPS